MVDPAELKPVEDVLNSKYDNGGYKGLQGMGKDAFYSTQCRGGGRGHVEWGESCRRAQTVQ